MEKKIDKILLFGSTGMLGRYIYSYFTRNNDQTLFWTGLNI